MVTVTDESVEVKVGAVKKAISNIDFTTLNQNIQQFHIPEIVKRGG